MDFVSRSKSRSSGVGGNMRRDEGKSSSKSNRC